MDFDLFNFIITLYFGFLIIYLSVPQPNVIKKRIIKKN
jgi:hypothetical protein